MADEIQNTGPTFATVTRIIELLEPLSASDREHVLRMVTTWYRVGVPTGAPLGASSVAPQASSPLRHSPIGDEKFSNRPVLSAKDFIFEKDPGTEPERLACLAYYLTHYMEMPHFKTADLTHLNTEAAQRRLSNPAVAASNAMRDGFFVSASKEGYKQLSAMGERFVHTLPNREAAQQIKQRMATRRGRKSGSSPSSSGESESGSQGS